MTLNLSPGIVLIRSDVIRIPFNMYLYADWIKCVYELMSYTGKGVYRSSVLCITHVIIYVQDCYAVFIRTVIHTYLCTLNNCMPLRDIKSTLRNVLQVLRDYKNC